MAVHMPNPALGKLARDLSPPQKLSARELCAHCGISANTLRYLKRLGYVSRPESKGGGAYYTLMHVKQVQTAQHLKAEIGTFSKIATYNEKRRANSDTHEGGYAVQYVFTLSTGIMIVAPEVLGELGKAQLRRLIAAGADDGMKRLAALTEKVLIGKRRGRNQRQNRNVQARGPQRTGDAVETNLHARGWWFSRASLV